MHIETITPQIFDHGLIQSFFTLKNEPLYGDARNIKGLNVGFNTDEAPKIITQNRKDLFKAFHIDANWIAFANQVHSNRVKVVTQGGTFAETDGLITRVPGLALAIQVADCAAVFIVDATTKTIAAVHAGWRGAASNIVPQTLEKMKAVGSEASHCKAFISPCICQPDFEVGPEVADQFPEQFVDYEYFKKPHINLKEFLAYQLQAGGLSANKIEVHPGCTVQQKQYYSYRREQKKSGRMMAVIQMKPGMDARLG